MNPVQKITPFLWFDDQAEEAVAYYTSMFPKSAITKDVRYGEAGPRPAGSVMTIAFQLDGQEFTALNGGPEYTFNPAISFVAKCETQEEIDRLWHRLVEGGQPIQCGWLTDRYGVTWQIVPTVLLDMLEDDDPKRVKRVAEAMFSMVKLDIAALTRAYQHEEASLAS
jgi:predicted 3-demethylubiquinone-9 3-methyltransferase (glyoxalase superfamily)